MGKNILHLSYLCVASHSNLAVLLRDDFFLDQNCVLIVGGHRQLRNFDLTLSHVDNHLEVKLFALYLFQNVLVFLLHIFFLKFNFSLASLSEFAEVT